MPAALPSGFPQPLPYLRMPGLVYLLLLLPSLIPHSMTREEAIAKGIKIAETRPCMHRRMNGHDYSRRGTYMVTIVTQHRLPLFGHIVGRYDAPHGHPDAPHIVLSALGQAVLSEEIKKISLVYPEIEVWKLCVMPDHLHLIVRVNAPLPQGKYLGNVIGAFKGGVSRAWRGEGPLFEENFNDRILMREGQLENWKAYLRANPYRWLVRHEHPEVMQRALCLEIGGVRYGAFGNFLLLRHPEKTQVFFHRYMEDDREDTGVKQTLDEQGQDAPRQSTQQPTAASPCQRHQALTIPTEGTRYWQQEHRCLIEAAEQGDVLVTPGISECEKRIKNECLQHRYRLIHLQTEPIGPYWKPESSRFDACAAGSLLILAPWAEDLKGDCDYKRFHNLNTLAATICAADGNTDCRIVTPERQDKTTSQKQ